MYFHLGKTILCALAAFGVASALAAQPSLKDLQPKPQDPDTVRAKIDEQNMKKIYEEEQAKQRAKSEQEREIDKIPKSTTATPTVDPYGGKVTIPMK